MTLTLGQRYHCHIDGWRIVTLISLHTSGPHKGEARVELLRSPWAKPDAVPPRVWVMPYDLNEVGDTTYHGPKLMQLVQEREDAKAQEQAKVDKMKAKGRRFHR
jgi:hypothetical protein